MARSRNGMEGRRKVRTSSKQTLARGAAQAMPQRQRRSVAAPLAASGPPRERGEEVYAAALRLFMEKG